MLTACEASFFDGQKRCRGSATDVSPRRNPLGSLTTIDVKGANAELASFLIHLDRGSLVVCARATGETLYHFRWASGYDNGETVRVQGVLEAAPRP